MKNTLVKTVTLGKYRLRQKGERVYLYLVENGYTEKYLAPLDKLVELYLKSQEDLVSTLDTKGQNNAEVNVTNDGKVTAFTRNEGGITSDTELQDFFNYCIKIAGTQTCKKYMSYLKKPVNGTHPSIKAWRMYYKMHGEYEKLKELKLPDSGSDLRLVTESEIREALSLARAKGDETSEYLLTLLIESGARLSEIVKILNEYEPANDTAFSNFAVYDLNWRRGRKKAFLIFHVSPLKKMSLDYLNTLAKLSRYINTKYIRKFVATKMFELGAPTEVVDFIEGRAPANVATKHYIYLFGSAKKFYEEKWLQYLKSLGLYTTAENNS